MDKRPVVIVAFEESDNLGTGYLASVLSVAGYNTRIIDFNAEDAEIVSVIQSLNPLIVGFSIIYQFYIHCFKRLIVSIREAGISCHLTAGGQYPSLRFTELFRFIPFLDSVVRFEGEYTFPELVNSLYSGTDWRKVNGIAYKVNNEVITTPLRPLEKDLDRFPLPMRTPLTEYAFGKKFASILAGRGCIHNCSFCNTREYYRKAGGAYKRIRRPQKVVEEMELLYSNKDCTVFLFQDDDFPLKTGRSVIWIDRFCDELRTRGLHNSLMWKINCRPDEVEPVSFAMMKEHGLFLVYLGIEDGTDYGLKRLNKGLTADRCREGVNTLRKLKINFDYGFMLFQPSSTFATVNENLDFLTWLCSDGISPLTFLKMIPFFDTRIEKELSKEERLIGESGSYTYEFYEESLNRYYEFTADCTLKWLRDSEGLLNVIRWARNYIAVYTRFAEPSPELSSIAENVRQITAESNLFLLDTLKELSVLFEAGKYNNGDYRGLRSFKESIDSMHDVSRTLINNQMIRLLRLFNNRQLRLSSFLPAED
jgi:radical SAM superfamily enzyme YgiQ (UPF0313 family)